MGGHFLKAAVVAGDDFGHADALPHGELSGPLHLEDQFSHREFVAGVVVFKRTARKGTRKPGPWVGNAWNGAAGKLQQIWLPIVIAISIISGVVCVLAPGARDVGTVPESEKAEAFAPSMVMPPTPAKPASGAVPTF